MIGSDTATLSLAATLLGTLVVSTWRFASLASKLTSTIEKLEEKVARVERGLDALEHLPELRIKVSQVEGIVQRLASEWPKLAARCDVMEHAIKHSREMRAVLMNARGSRPDIDEEE